VREHRLVMLQYVYHDVAVEILECCNSYLMVLHGVAVEIFGCCKCCRYVRIL
jgi:hypothetical protein